MIEHTNHMWHAILLRDHRDTYVTTATTFSTTATIYSTSGFFYHVPSPLILLQKNKNIRVAVQGVTISQYREIVGVLPVNKKKTV